MIQYRIKMLSGHHHLLLGTGVQFKDGCLSVYSGPEIVGYFWGVESCIKDADVDANGDPPVPYDGPVPGAAPIKDPYNSGPPLVRSLEDAEIGYVQATIDRLDNLAPQYWKTPVADLPTGREDVAAGGAVVVGHAHLGPAGGVA